MIERVLFFVDLDQREETAKMGKVLQKERSREAPARLVKKEQLSCRSYLRVNCTKPSCGRLQFG